MGLPRAGGDFNKEEHWIKARGAWLCVDTKHDTTKLIHTKKNLHVLVCRFCRGL